MPLRTPEPPVDPEACRRFGRGAVAFSCVLAALLFSSLYTFWHFWSSPVPLRLGDAWVLGPMAGSGSILAVDPDGGLHFVDLNTTAVLDFSRIPTQRKGLWALYDLYGSRPYNHVTLDYHYRQKPPPINFRHVGSFRLIFR